MQSHKSRSSVGGRYRTIQNDRYGDSKKDKIRSNLVKLAKAIFERFEKVSTAFREFDLRTMGYVTFSDFAYIIDTMNLGFDRDSIL